MHSGAQPTLLCCVVPDLSIVAREEVGGGQGLGLEMSKWVEQKLHGFNKFVGFPIDGLEQQCMALLLRIEGGK